MDSRNSNSLMLWLGLLGLFLVIVGSVYSGRSSAGNLETRLEAEVTRSLADAGVDDWAEFEMDGQRAIFLNEPPSQEALATAQQAALKSVGAGGVILGGVTKVSFKNGHSSPIESGDAVSPFVWSATPKDGKLVLSGNVPSGAVKNHLLSKAIDVYKGDVVDQTVVADGAPGTEAQWRDVASLGLEQAAKLEQGKAVLTDTSLKVSGMSGPNGSAEVSESLENVSSPFAAELLLALPYDWSISLTDTGLVLEGQAPDAKEKETLLNAAKLRFGGQVVDNMTIGGEGGWIDAAITGIGHLKNFENGRLSLDDQTFRFSGEASESTLRYLTEDMQPHINGHSVVYDINTVRPQLDELDDLDLSADAEDRDKACSTAFSRVMSADRIYFKTGRNDIDRKSGLVLDKLVEIARRCDGLKITIEGHTDNRGDRDMNIALSERRASSVQAYFIERGLDPAILFVSGVGPDQPTDTNDTSEGRANNRRIEFKVTN